jgi:hypothetical protein
VRTTTRNVERSLKRHHAGGGIAEVPTAIAYLRLIALHTVSRSGR